MQRLDKYLQELLNARGILISRTATADIVNSVARVNGKVEKRSYRLREEDSVEVDEVALEKALLELEEERQMDYEIVAEDTYSLQILSESENYLVLIKPAGVVVHPGVKVRSGTLANHVKSYLTLKGEYDARVERAGLVHRLDKGVGGIILFAKNLEAQRHYKMLFENHRVEKLYFAEIERIDGVKDMLVENEWVRVGGFIGRDQHDRKRMMFDFESSARADERRALSYIYKLNERFALVKIETGRKHQIRASLKRMGYIVRGDELYRYGSGKAKNPDQIGLFSFFLRLQDLDGSFKYWSLLEKL